MASFEWFVSLRYLRAKRKQKFISLITVISILGVAVGVLALIVVLSVYTGFTEGLRDQIIGVNAHVLVQRFGSSINDSEGITAKIEAVAGVEATTPFIYGQALISSATHSTGVVLRGIDASLRHAGAQYRPENDRRPTDRSRQTPRSTGHCPWPRHGPAASGRCWRPGAADLAQRAALAHGRPP